MDTPKQMDPKLVQARANLLQAAADGLHFHTLWTHVKTGNDYRIVGFCVREHDVVQCVLYTRNVLNLVDVMNPIWCRPVREFMDGRFVKKSD